MKILTHRGYWLNDSEKNSSIAFERSFALDLGTETDIRDSLGKLVISHDMPLGLELELSEFLRLAARFSDIQNPMLLALNIKADGLAVLLAKHLESYPQLDCFVFDMAIPDMRQYFNVGVPVFTRMSEIEMSPSFLDRAAGVWLDAFESEWYNNDVIENLLNQGKRVCIVSAELHGRSNLEQWRNLKIWSTTDQVLLCTDKPEDAREYFCRGYV
jgi:hypothetical protein